MEIDLADINLQDGRSYEDNYSGFIQIFKKIAETPASENVIIHNAPWSWVPLLRYLKCQLLSARPAFAHCWCVRQALCQDPNPFLGRTTIEVLSTFRSETVECLRKVDCEWKTDRTIAFPLEMEFIVTNSSSFHRKEVLNFAKLLDEYTPPTKKVLLVPASAEKPYPSPLHKACLEILPDSFYLACISSVLGIVPQELWHRMPCYSSGVRNEWHLYEIARRYFRKHKHTNIVVYCDPYAHVLHDVLCVSPRIESVVHFTVLPPSQYEEYENLLDPELLQILKEDLERWK